MVHVYGVRPERSTQTGSVYQQHVRYMQENNIIGMRPRDLFEYDFLNQLRVWRQQGDRLLVMIDANEHVLTGKMCRQLPAEGLDLREATKDVLGELCPNTHLLGSMPIDGVWVTPDLTVTSIKWLGFKESPGDHRACIFDVTTLSAIGQNKKKIVMPACCRLTSKCPTSTDNYVTEMDSQFKIH